MKVDSLGQMTAGRCLCRPTLPFTAQARAPSRAVLLVRLRRRTPGPADAPSPFPSPAACGGSGLTSPPLSLCSREKSEDAHVQGNPTGAPAHLRLSRLPDLVSSGRSLRPSDSLSLSSGCPLFTHSPLSLVVWTKNWIAHVACRSFSIRMLYRLISFNVLPPPPPSQCGPTGTKLGQGSCAGLIFAPIMRLYLNTGASSLLGPAPTQTLICLSVKGKPTFNPPRRR